jgi:diketogulonate reductase-like aldo/keto reductase
MIPTVKLHNGTEIPQVGLGLWRVKDKQQCMDAVQFALDAGYRHFDTAQIYGNEAFLGEALQKSGVDRKEVFITTKIWNENQWWDNFMPSFEESLKNLQTDYVDLLLLHFPVTETRGAAWRKMEDAHKSGRAKAVGVSNYTIRHLEELMQQSKLKPVVNQVELHVYLQQPELVEFCKQHGIVVEAYSPLAHGVSLDNETLEELAKKYHKSTAQIMLRWCVEQGLVPLPKSTHQERIASNIDVFDFSLTPEDMQQLEGLEAGLRTCWDPTNIS